MKSLLSWLLTFFAAMYWFARLVFTFTSTINQDMGVKISNINLEIGMLFLTLILILLVFKRVILGGMIYFLTMTGYLGREIYLCVSSAIDSSSNLAEQVDGVMNSALSVSNIMTVFVAALGIVISFAVFSDIVFNRNRAKKTNDKKTDWFFQNEAYDRKFDERADKNNYKF